MTDQTVPLSNAEQAVRMERIEGAQALLAQQVRGSMDNFTAAVQSMQMDMRAALQKVDEATKAAAHNAHNGQSIARIEHDLQGIGNRLDQWTHEYEANRDRWREKHEGDNRDMERRLETSIVSVRESTIRIVAYASGAGGLGMLILGGFLWSLNDRFNNTSIAIAQARAMVVEADLRDVAALDKQRDKLHAIELYLARGGENKARPYNPEQRTTDGTEK